MSEQPKEVLRASEANTHAASSTAPSRCVQRTLRTLCERVAEAVKRAREAHAYRNITDGDQPALFECDCGFISEHHFEMWEHRDAVFAVAALIAVSAHVEEVLAKRGIKPPEFSNWRHFAEIAGLLPSQEQT